jgi:hypothetical protein
VLPDEEEDFDPEEDPELELLVPDDRAPDDLEDDPEDDRDGALADDEDLPDDDGAPRTDGARVYGDPDPMFRLGRVGEVRGTMTGRDEPEYEFGRPPPTRGETGCRTRGEDEFRVLGRVGEVRAVGREDELRVLGRLRPLGGSVPRLGDERPALRLKGPVVGSTRVRVLPPDPESTPLPVGLVPPTPPPPLPGR